MESILYKHAYAVPCVPCGCEGVFIDTVGVLDFARELSRKSEPHTLLVICIEKERIVRSYQDLQLSNHSKLNLVVHTHPQGPSQPPFSPFNPLCPPDTRNESNEIRARSALRCDNLGNHSKTCFGSQNFLLVPVVSPTAGQKAN